VGEALVGLGDLDGDGFDDFAVGAPQAELLGGLNNAGIVWAYRGTNTVDGNGQLTPTQVWNRIGDSAELRLGQKLAAGDVDCDGKQDLIISAFDLTNLNATGRVEAHSGRGTSPFFAASFWSKDGESHAFGSAIASAGNVNGAVNGAIKCDSIIVGDFSFDNGGDAANNFGKAYIYTGSAAGLSAAPTFTKAGTALRERFGRAVDGGQDLNNDGLDDVIISSQLTNSSGRVDVFAGNATTTLVDTPFWSATSGVANSFFGLAVALLPDVNTDGRADVAVGANNADSGAGALYVFFNSAGGLPGIPSWTYVGADNKARVGTAVIAAGDVNNDGGQDFVVAAASGTTTAGTSAGRVSVFHGIGGCLISGDTFASGAANPNNPCEVCDPSRTAIAWSSATNGTSCSDGNLCTSTDVCQAGVCQGNSVVCAQTTTTCRPRTCNNNSGVCETSGLPDGSACAVNDNLTCTGDGVCSSDRCIPEIIAGCLINGVCFADGAESPTSACKICNSSINKRKFISAPPTKLCDDGNSCTSGDRCYNGGSCIGKTLLPNGNSCDDANACTENTTCSTGVCSGGTNICP
jgi:hypothetical protein